MLTSDIPKELVYEEVGSRPIYYKNYHKVLLQQATLEEIMGSSESQAIVISAILRHLYRHLNDTNYWIATNELGVHLGHNTNRSVDIAIFDRQQYKPQLTNYQYMTTAPVVAIEVDIRADLSDYPSPQDYYREKARDLQQFGVQKIIWISTAAKTFMLNDSLSHQSWLEAVEILPDMPPVSIGLLVNNFLKP